MKVIAFNSSPNMDKGNTHLILAPFLDGLTEAGAEVELFYTKKLKVKPCEGEFHCILKKPGECIIKDDMQWIYPKWGGADICVYATPLYCEGMTSTMKRIIDRESPLSSGLFELYNGYSAHPLRNTVNLSKIVLISNCGFPELENFDALLHQFANYCKRILKNGKPLEFAGALLRPSGPMLMPMKEMGVPVDDIFDAAKEAGRQLVQEGKMSPETLKIVSRDFVPYSVEEQHEFANKFIRQSIDEARNR
ncbi:MAG: flavodoxin family protein [Deltaproteobacteria bacterium]|nr:flavodoxin family protein [Deltaproteobacteria bacterium]